MNNLLNQLAFDAIRKNRPQLLEFYLSKLKINANAVKPNRENLFTRMLESCFCITHSTYTITLVQFAISNQNLECLQVLLENGADVYPRREYYNVIDHQHWRPPLHMAMHLFWQDQYDGAEAHSPKAVLGSQMVTLLLRLVH